MLHELYYGFVLSKNVLVYIVFTRRQCLGCLGTNVKVQTESFGSAANSYSNVLAVDICQCAENFGCCCLEWFPGLSSRLAFCSVLKAPRMPQKVGGICN